MSVYICAMSQLISGHDHPIEGFRGVCFLSTVKSINPAGLRPAQHHPTRTTNSTPEYLLGSAGKDNEVPKCLSG